MNDILKTRMAWPATAEADSDGAVVVAFRDIPQAHAFGDSLATALDNAADALAEALAATMAARRDIPAPTRRRKGEHDVAPDPVIALKALVYTAMRARGFNQADMAERLGVDAREIRRLLDPAHTGTKISRYAEALAACDLGLEIAARPAA